MSKHILIINTSPRLSGNSHALSAELARGAEAVGHNVEIIEAGNADIHPCLGCDHCRRNKSACVHKDAMTGILAAIDRADVVAFSGPLYYYGLPAQMKLIMDRFYIYNRQYPRRECLLLMTCADQGTKSFAAAEHNYQMALIDYIGWRDRGRILADSVNDPEDIQGRGELQQAYELGRRL